MKRKTIKAIIGNKKARLTISDGLSFFNPGSVLLSHDLSVIVSSALEGLTSVFGMGTGVAPPVKPPRNSNLKNAEFNRSK